jgi:hypothetical protein
VLGISSCEHECHSLASSSSAQFGQPLPLGVEFAHVQAPKLIEAIGIVPVRTTKGVAWSELARSIVDVSLIPTQSAGPDTVDEDTMTIAWIGKLIRTLQPNVHLATITLNSSATVIEGLPALGAVVSGFGQIPQKLRIARHETVDGLPGTCTELHDREPVG